MKCLNNGIEFDHAPIKKFINTGRSFRVRKLAWSTTQSYESQECLNKGQFDFWLRYDERKMLMWEQSAFINSPFNVKIIFYLIHILKSG